MSRSIRPVLTTLLGAGAIGVGIVLAFVAVLWRYQERIVFQPPGSPYPTGGPARRLDFGAADGQLLTAYLVGAPTAGKLLIAFHGNADLAAWQVPWAVEVVRRTDRAVLLAEYRGYAGLGGTPSYAAGSIDARAAYGIARDSLGFAPSDIALFGHSLGSAIAAELAREMDPEVLVLQSPLTSARDMARLLAAHITLPFWSLISRFHYDTEAVVRSLNVPVWVAHGRRDGVVPIRMGQRVFDAAKVKGELLLITRAGHNDIVATAGEEYWNWLTRALVSDQHRRDIKK